MTRDSATEPFTAFSFRVEIRLPGASAPLADAAFASCEGLEMRFDVSSLVEGGSPGTQRLFSSPAAPGHVTMRRGMTSSFDLWQWCTAVARDRGPRADCVVVVLAPDGETEQARFRLRGCLPVRLRGPALDAMSGGVAIEELELACESLSLDTPAAVEPTRTAIERLELRELDDDFQREINKRRWVQAQLNPAALDLAYTNADPRESAAGTAALGFELWLDSAAETPMARRSPVDIPRLAEAFAYFVTPRPVRASQQLRAPAARLVWGDFSFDGYVDSLRQSFDLFEPNGRPGRARLTITMTRPWIAKPH